MKPYNTNDWPEFQLLFEREYPHFLPALTGLSDKLSKCEVRLCIYLRLGLGTKDIIGELGIAQSTLSEQRGNIRRKLCLTTGVDLSAFLESLPGRITRGESADQFQRSHVFA